VNIIRNTKILQHKINRKKLKPCLVASHDLQPRNRAYPIVQLPGSTQDADASIVVCQIHWDTVDWSADHHQTLLSSNSAQPTSASQLCYTQLHGMQWTSILPSTQFYRQHSYLMTEHNDVKCNTSLRHNKHTQHSQPTATTTFGFCLTDLHFLSYFSFDQVLCGQQEQMFCTLGRPINNAKALRATYSTYSLQPEKITLWPPFFLRHGLCTFMPLVVLCSVQIHTAYTAYGIKIWRLYKNITVNIAQ